MSPAVSWGSLFAPLQQGVPVDTGALLARYGDALVSFAVTLGVFVATFVVIYVVARWALVRITRRGLGTRDFSPAVISLGSSLAAGFALVGAFAMAATIAGFGVFLAALATLTGALLLALGFAAQDLIANFVAGVFILMDEPFTPGDYIEWDGHGGVVREIRLRVTTLDTFDNEYVTVPNAELAGSVVTNPDANDTRRVSCDFGIDYDADIDRARSIVLEVGGGIDGVLKEPAPSAPVTALGDSAVVLTGRVWIDPSEISAAGVRAAFTEAVKKRFDEAGIEMPYPHTELVGSLSVSSARPDAAPASGD